MHTALSVSDLPQAFIAAMRDKKIDIAASLDMLNRINADSYDGNLSIEVQGVPPVDGKTIIPLGPVTQFSYDAGLAASRLQALGVDLPASVKFSGDTVSFPADALEEIGIQLFSVSAWGVLNGGLATSYADTKKNLSLGQELFDSIKDNFRLLEPLCRNKPKGITPAYINPDGSAGESFLLLKMRASLLQAKKYIQKYGKPLRPILPFFEMTSEGTRNDLATEYARYSRHPFVASLIRETGTDSCSPKSACQTLLAALTHSADGKPRGIFAQAFGKNDSPLALPGGHGQSFRVLADIYRGLLAEGYRYAYLGNVDNIGYTVNAAELAIMAISGAEAGFDFAFRTAVDVKGGILVVDRNGRKTVADIGQAISFSDVEKLERSGQKILFNCATGIFDLQALVPKLEAIAENLPIRISDQDKDAGRYSQAEQSTWEVIGLLENSIGFAVDKSERFLAAKLLVETILASTGNSLPPAFAPVAKNLSDGLSRLLGGPCGLSLKEGRWTVAD